MTGNRFMAAWLGGALLIDATVRALPSVPWELIGPILGGLAVAYFVTRREPDGQRPRAGDKTA